MAPMPGKIYVDQINLNGRILFTVTSNPNGVLLGNAGDLAIRTDAPNGTVYVNVDGALAWATFLTTASAGAARWGNVVFVDQVFGSNATGARNGLPFLTIGAAITASLAGDVVWVLPGTYTESIVTKAGVSVVGLDRDRCILDRTGVAVATDIVTVAASVRIKNFVILGSTAAAATLRGVVFSGGGAESTSTVQNCRVSLAHTGAGTCVGVQCTGGGSPGSEHATLDDCSIFVSGTGAQIRRGLYVSAGSSSPTAKNCDIRVTRGGAAVGTYYGVESAGGAGSVITLRGGNVEGPTGAGGADISQTSGTIVLNESTNLATNNANALPFLTGSGTVESFSWHDPGALTGGVTRFMRPDADSTVGDVQQWRLPSARIARSMTVRAATAPGGGRTDTWTLFKNGVATPLVVSLSNAVTEATFEGVSVGFATTDKFSMRMVTNVATATTDPVVTVEFY